MFTLLLPLLPLLQEPADVLDAGAVDLAALHMVRELLPRIPALVGEVGSYLTTVKVNMAIIERFKHPVRAGVLGCCCKSISV